MSQKKNELKLAENQTAADAQQQQQSWSTQLSKKLGQTSEAQVSTTVDSSLGILTFMERDCTQVNFYNKS